MVAPIHKTRDHHTLCHMKSTNIFEAFPYYVAFMRYIEFCELLKTTIIAPINGTPTRFFKG